MRSCCAWPPQPAVAAVGLTLVVREQGVDPVSPEEVTAVGGVRIVAAEHHERVGVVLELVVQRLALVRESSGGADDEVGLDGRARLLVVLAGVHVVDPVGVPVEGEDARPDGRRVGMNVLPGELDSGKAYFGGVEIGTEHHGEPPAGAATLELGVRPEFVRFAEEGVPVEIVKVSDAGRYSIVEMKHGESAINLLLAEDEALPTEGARIVFDPARTRIYADGWVVN